MTISTRLSAALFAVFAAGAASAQSPAASPHERSITAGYVAAFTCSATFNAGRSQDAIAADELHRIYGDYRGLLSDVEVQIDREVRRVTASFGNRERARVAVWRPHLGCAQLPSGAGADSDIEVPRLPDGIVAPELAETDARNWPDGDHNAFLPIPGPQQVALDEILDRAFDSESYGPGTETTAVLVVSEGRLIGESYREGFDRHMPQRTWSVAKSIAATVIGRAVELENIDLAAPAPIPAYAKPGDPRGAISWHNLLHMGSGLASGTAGNRTDDVYFGGMAVTDSIAGLPLVAEPGSLWRYANNDTMLAMVALRETLGDERALAFPLTELLGRIGMTRTTPETDWQGSYVMSSQVWTTARDLARLGLLYLNDGVWNGERLLPEGWSEYVATPAPAQPDRNDGVGYGAQFWLLGEAQGLPNGTYAAMGNRGQYVMIVPERDIVVVRRGYDPVGEGRRFDIASFTRDILAAVEE